MANKNRVSIVVSLNVSRRTLGQKQKTEYRFLFKLSAFQHSAAVAVGVYNGMFLLALVELHMCRLYCAPHLNGKHLVNSCMGRLYFKECRSEEHQRFKFKERKHPNVFVP